MDPGQREKNDIHGARNDIHGARIRARRRAPRAAVRGPRAADPGHRITYTGPRRRQQVTDRRLITAGGSRARAPRITNHGRRTITRANGSRTTYQGERPRRSIPRAKNHGPRAGGRRPDSRRGGPRARAWEPGELERSGPKLEGRPSDRYRRARAGLRASPPAARASTRAGNKKGPREGPSVTAGGAGPRARRRPPRADPRRASRIPPARRSMGSIARTPWRRLPRPIRSRPAGLPRSCVPP